MKKGFFPKFLSLGLYMGGLFGGQLSAQSIPDEGPIRLRRNPGMDVLEGLEFRDTASGALLRLVDFAQDHPFADLGFPRKKALSPYCVEWDLSQVPMPAIRRALDLEAEAYEALYGTSKTCFKGARLQALPEINGAYVAVNYRLLVFGGEGELWRPICPHFLGIRSHIRVYDRTGGVVFEKATGWSPVTGAQVTDDGRFLVVNQDEIPGDLPLFMHRFTEGSVWDLRTGQPIDSRWFGETVRGDRRFRVVGKWVVAQLGYWTEDSKQKRLKSTFFDFDSKVKYERDVSLSEYNHTRECSEGYFWEDPKTRRIVRSELIERDLKKTPIH
jgi:hypothetical protein